MKKHSNRTYTVFEKQWKNKHKEQWGCNFNSRPTLLAYSTLVYCKFLLYLNSVKTSLHIALAHWVLL